MDTNFGIDNSAFAVPSKPVVKAERNPNSAWLKTFMVGLVISAVLAVLSTTIGGILAMVVVMAIGTFITLGVTAVVVFFTSGKG